MDVIDTDDLPTERRRGFWLSAFLILMFVTNPLAAFYYFTAPEAIVLLYPNASVGLIYLLGVICVFNLVLAALIWAWRRVGVYGFYLVIAVAFAINLYIDVGLAGSLTGLIGGIIVFFTTRKRWQYFV